MSGVPASTARRSGTQADLLSLDDAIARLLASVEVPAADRAETVSTFDALHRVLAEDVTSLIDVPPADNSEMDGYAVRSADVAEAGTVLRVSQRIAAGSVGSALEAATAARIFTGAQIPPGADAVVMQEQCSVVDAGVRIDTAPPAGQSVRRRGEDVRRDSVVLAAGIAPQAAIARHGGFGRCRPTCASRAAHGSRCSPPATSWRCPATRSSLAPSTTRTVSRCAP